jgi:hypothetical protein
MFHRLWLGWFTEYGVVSLGSDMVSDMVSDVVSDTNSGYPQGFVSLGSDVVVSFGSDTLELRLGPIL